MMFVADGHCDYLYGAVNYGYDFRNPSNMQQNVTLSRLQNGRVKLQTFAAWTDMSLRIPPLQQAHMMIDAYHTLLNENSELQPMSADATDHTKIETVLTIEGGEALEGSLSVLRNFFLLGVRAIALTWNDNNELSGAALGRGNKGLTALGVDIVREMDRLGIAIDVSHLSDRGIDDVLKIAERPIYASHSNCRDVYSSPRSLKKEHIKAIAAQGGTIGINFYNKQLTSQSKACVQDIVAQFQYLADVGGIECCAIGSDFDGMPLYPVDLQTSEDFPNLAEALLQEGFSKEDVEKIMYMNLHRYLLQFV